MTAAASAKPVNVTLHNSRAYLVRVVKALKKIRSAMQIFCATQALRTHA